MQSMKAHLDALKEAQGRTTPGWKWFFDEETGIICAEKGHEVCHVFTPHSDVTEPNGYPTPACRHDALLIVEALNKLPNLLEALDRVLGLAEELDDMADKRQRAAHTARQAARYDLSEAHRQSVNRVRAIKQAFLQEIAEAFSANPEPASTISEYYQESLTDEWHLPTPTG